MPIEGLPDPARHRVCMRCTKWFEPDEGSAAVVRRTRRLALHGVLALALLWAVVKEAGWL
jgi:hypothetical protein